MTSGSILPTFGPASPHIRRAPIARNLQPDVQRPIDGPLSPRNLPRNISDSDNVSGVRVLVPASINLAGSSAVAVQTAESAQDSLPVAIVPQILPSDSDRFASQLTDTESENEENLTDLTEEEEAYVKELRAIDREVRAHETAHASAGGGYAGRPSYEYITGPDGVRYAVSGSVQIDVRPVEGDPEATIRKLEIVRRAALAPAEPSGQDRAVAAQAAASIREAKAELAEKRSDEASGIAQEKTNDNADALAGNVEASGVEPQQGDTKSPAAFAFPGDDISETPRAISETLRAANRSAESAEQVSRAAIVDLFV